MRSESGFAATATLGGTPGDEYDELPYPSMPFAYTQPAHLAALAALYGHKTPPASAARVLELGCASGGNIIPLAARFPQASFLGIDISHRHVEDGRRRIAALGLSNVEIRQGDLAEFSSTGADFDYVICHGVFSWVPKDVQDAVLRICSASLTENGVAAISYNVFPGWRLRGAVRDICLHYAGAELSPRRRVEKARQALERIAASASDADPYGLLLRNEAKRITKLPSAYIHGEFLTAHNNPCYFSEFAARARQHGLSYLCEGDLASSMSQARLPRAGEQPAGGGRLELEQSVDFFTGRPFRRSLLVRARASDDAERKPNPDLLHSLHFASEIRLDPGRSDAQSSMFRDSAGRTITVEDSAVRDALLQLAEHYPATQTLEQLTPPIGRNGDPEAAARIRNAIFHLAASDRAALSSLPLHAGRAEQERPRAWPLARLEAAQRQPWLTSLRHTAVPSNPALAFLLIHLDGAHDREMLTARLAGALQRGDVSLPPVQSGEKTNGPRPDHESAGPYVEKTLIFCASQALLEPLGLAGAD